jgi:hypothetical protein
MTLDNAEILSGARADPQGLSPGSKNAVSMRFSKFGGDLATKEDVELL